MTQTSKNITGSIAIAGRLHDMGDVTTETVGDALDKDLRMVEFVDEQGEWFVVNIEVEGDLSVDAVLKPENGDGWALAADMADRLEGSGYRVLSEWNSATYYLVSILE